jgi:hypothetical protein
MRLKRASNSGTSLGAAVKKDPSTSSSVTYRFESSSKKVSSLVNNGR